jgi:hypothetical protein
MVQMMKVGILATLLCLASTAPVHAYSQYAPQPVPAANCASDPPASTAYLFTNTDYHDNCYVLSIPSWQSDPWASWDATMGFPNDQIQSAKVGSGTYLVLFWHSFNTQDNGAPLSFTGNMNNLGSWNRQASAARVQTFAPGVCGDSGNLLILWTDMSYQGDCTELTLGNSRPAYWDAVKMGFRNDTASSLANRSTQLYETICTNAQFDGCDTVAPNFSTGTMTIGGYGWNDILSSAY